ncbi:MAG: aminopeptidase [Candidatus Omnitrophota bacterium]
MRDPRIETLADILVNYSAKVKKDDVVLIDFAGVRALPLVEAIYGLCLKNRARCVEYQFSTEELSRKFYELADEEQLSYFPAHRLAFMKKATVYIGINASENTQAFAGIDLGKMVKRQQVLRPIIDRRVDFSRWIITRYPSVGLAQDAKMSLEDFEDFYFRACNMDWPLFARKIGHLWRLVREAGEVRITASDTEIRFSKKGIPAVKSEGLRNMPDGEVYTAPVRDSIEGYITYNTPSFYHGKEFDGVRFEFRKGRIVSASCRQGSVKELQKILDTDQGSRYVGEFAFGLNKNITQPVKNILFDEKISGSIHLTPGQAYKIADNGNRSSIHWDLVKLLKGDGEVYFDGKLIQKDGKFVVKELKGLN